MGVIQRMIQLKVLQHAKTYISNEISYQQILINLELFLNVVE